MTTIDVTSTPTLEWMAAPVTRTPEVHVVGHRNPDTDSIASAVGYAELKNLLEPGTRWIAARLGEVNPQTRWALDQGGAVEPAFLPHIYLRVADVMRERFPVVHQEAPVRVAGQVMAREGLDLLPVVDDAGRLVGVLTERALARRYVRETQTASHLEAPTRVEALVEMLHGELVHGSLDQRADGRVWVLAMATSSMLGEVDHGDVAVVGDRIDAQLRAVETDVAVLVLSNDVVASPELIAAADEHDTAIIRTPLDSYVAARMITLSSPCRVLADPDPLTVDPGHLVADITDDVKDVSYRAAVVVDAHRIPIGLVTRADLVDPHPRRVVLVDHAEQAQSVPGIEHAEIVEILDHHHIGSIETKLPIRATFDPVGSTATLVAERFRSGGMRPRRPTATLLLAAVLSDTVVLNSPTTTERDHVAAGWLAELLGVDLERFGRNMFLAASDLSGEKASTIVSRDAKEYELDDGTMLCIAQVETVGDGVLSRLDELRAAIVERRERGGQRLYALMVTDVLAKATRLVVDGDLSLAERAFGPPGPDGTFDLPGVMSRKKQVAPNLLRAGS